MTGRHDAGTKGRATHDAEPLDECADRRTLLEAVDPTAAEVDRCMASVDVRASAAARPVPALQSEESQRSARTQRFGLSGRPTESS